MYYQGSRVMGRRRGLFFAIVSAALVVAFFPYFSSAATPSCDYFSDDFSGGSANQWTSDDSSNWFFQNGWLNVGPLGVNTMTYAGTAFSPPAYFVLDVDIPGATPGSFPLESPAFGIYPFTTKSGVSVSVEGRSLDGVGAIVWTDGTASFMGWDLAAGKYYVYGAAPLPQTLTSVGVAYSATEITLRLNKQNASLKVTGTFPLSVLPDTLWLFAEGLGTQVAFDNVCAGPLSTPPAKHSLMVNKTGAGSGTITSSPAGINCGGSCAASYTKGSTVTLTASADAGSSFSGWSGGGCSGTGSCMLSLNADTVVTAAFTTSAAAFPAPKNLRYTLNGAILTINWDAVAGATGYIGGVGQQSGKYDGFADLGNITSFGPVDAAGVPAGTYYIVMKAYEGTQESGLSNEIAITIPGPGGDETIFTIMTNPTDGEILSAKGNDGTTVQYYGSRDADGIPTSIDRIQVAGADGKTTWVELDSSKRPSRMVSADGVVFDLSYPGGNEAVVTAVAPDNTTIKTNFILGNEGLYDQVSPSMTSETEMSLLCPADTMSSPAGASGEADWIIQLRRCDIGITDALVGYEIRVPGALTGIPAASGNAKNIGGGNYVASIPTGLKPSLSKEKVLVAAEKIAYVLGYGCDALSKAGHPETFLALMCPAVGLQLITVVGPGGPAIGAACVAVSGAVIAYCKTLGESGAVGFESLGERIAKGLQDPKIWESTNITLTAKYWLRGDMWESAPKSMEVPANGPFPTNTINISYSTDPADYCDSILDGTWSGTWNSSGPWQGCTYNDGGDITITLAHHATMEKSGFSTGSVVSATGIHLLYLTDNPDKPKCSLDHIETSSGGIASVNRTGDTVKLAFSLPYSGGTQHYTGTLKLSNNNNTLSGPIVMGATTGSITLTRQ